MTYTNCFNYQLRYAALLMMICIGSGTSNIAYAQNTGSSQIMPNATPGHRQIPSSALLGQMQTRQANVVAINGVDWLVSPGATIRNERNLLTNVTALYAGRTVRYTTNSQGMVDKIWILDGYESTDDALENAGVEQPNVLRLLTNQVINSLF